MCIRMGSHDYKSKWGCLGESKEGSKNFKFVGLICAGASIEMPEVINGNLYWWE